MKNPLLANAITQWQLIELQYDGFARLVEPHAYGIGSDSTEKLLCWQVSGGSTSGERHGWKLLNVNDIRATTMSAQGFSSPRTGYKRGAPPMRHIYAQL